MNRKEGKVADYDNCSINVYYYHDSNWNTEYL